MDQFQFLNLATKPLILDAEKAGWLYGEWSREDVLLLCRRGQERPLFCGFDRDDTGEAMAQAMIRFHPSIHRLRPSRKDWNDVLRLGA
jgi:hypothetical protein